MPSRGGLHSLNPFSKRDEHSPRSILIYKVLTILSLLLVHITNIHFAWNAPNDGKGAAYKTIWQQNSANPSPFALNPTIVDIYWVVILILQVGYVFHLFTGSQTVQAANVGSHFIFNNVFMFAFVLCWVHSQLALALVFLIINHFNLSSLYFRHSTTPLSVHIPVVSGPLAWNYTALFWCGAALVHQSLVDERRLVARIIGNIAIWSFLGYGWFYLIAFKDWTMSLNLSVLMAALGVHQLVTVKTFALQWIFAFVIMAILFAFSVPLAIAHATGRQIGVARGAVVNEDRERQPLLNDGGQESGRTSNGLFG